MSVDGFAGGCDGRSRRGFDVGFYDVRCALTGVSLLATRAVCILIERVGSAWRPMSLPIRGPYDRLGAIDMVPLDAVAQLLAAGFARALDEGRLSLAGEAEARWRSARDAGPIAWVLQTIERAAAFGSARFEGREVALTLLNAVVVDAIVANQPSLPAGSDDEQLVVALGPEARDASPGATADEVTRARRELLALDRWIVANGGWAPPTVFDAYGEQHRYEDILRGLRGARRRFAETPWMAAALDRYSDEAESVARHEPDMPRRWLRNADRSWYGLVAGRTRLAFGHRQSLARLFARWSEPDDLVGAAVEALAVDRGEVVARVDLRPYVVLRHGEHTATLGDEERCMELLTRPGPEAEATLSVDDVGLPELVGPRLAARDSAVLTRPTPTPPWWQSDAPEGIVEDFGWCGGPDPALDR